MIVLPLHASREVTWAAGKTQEQSVLQQASPRAVRDLLSDCTVRTALQWSLLIFKKLLLQVNVKVFTTENPQNLEVSSTDVFLQVTRTIQLLILDENFYKTPSRKYLWHRVFLLKSAFSGLCTHPSYARYFLERSLPSRRPVGSLFSESHWVLFYL